MAQFGTYIGNGVRCGAAALSVADTLGGLGAVLLTGGIVVGGIFPQLMSQGGVQQLCSDFRAAAAQVSDRSVIEAGCLGAGFQGHARVGMGTAAVIVQQLFRSRSFHIRIGIVVGNETIGQVIGIGGDFTVS